MTDYSNTIIRKKIGPYNDKIEFYSYFPPETRICLFTGDFISLVEDNFVQPSCFSNFLAKLFNVPKYEISERISKTFLVDKRELDEVAVKINFPAIVFSSSFLFKKDGQPLHGVTEFGIGFTFADSLKESLQCYEPTWPNILNPICYGNALETSYPILKELNANKSEKNEVDYYKKMIEVVSIAKEEILASRFNGDLFEDPAYDALEGNDGSFALLTPVGLALAVDLDPKLEKISNIIKNDGMNLSLMPFNIHVVNDDFEQTKTLLGLEN